MGEMKTFFGWSLDDGEGLRVFGGCFEFTFDYSMVFREIVLGI